MKRGKAAKRRHNPLLWIVSAVTLIAVFAMFVPSKDSDQNDSNSSSRIDAAESSGEAAASSEPDEREPSGSEDAREQEESEAAPPESAASNAAQSGNSKPGNSSAGRAEGETSEPAKHEPPGSAQNSREPSGTQVSAPDLSAIPAFSGTSYAVVNGNIPEFSEEDLTTVSYETYSAQDSLGRCGPAVASIGTDLMPTEERGSIGQVKPSGWHTVKYDFVDGKYLYNRCHLIGYQLTAENANTRNLITGTRYLNTEGMLPFENMVADYIKETGNHVLYRVTPVFEGENLVASGVQMEAESVEDRGEGILFNVYCYNVQPGVQIDYASGDSQPDGASGTQTAAAGEPEQTQGQQNAGGTAGNPEQTQDQQTTGAASGYSEQAQGQQNADGTAGNPEQEQAQDQQTTGAASGYSEQAPEQTWEESTAPPKAAQRTF